MLGRSFAFRRRSVVCGSPIAAPLGVRPGWLRPMPVRGPQRSASRPRAERARQLLVALIQKTSLRAKSDAKMVRQSDDSCGEPLLDAGHCGGCECGPQSSGPRICTRRPWSNRRKRRPGRSSAARQASHHTSSESPQKEASPETPERACSPSARTPACAHLGGLQAACRLAHEGERHACRDPTDQGSNSPFRRPRRRAAKGCLRSPTMRLPPARPPRHR